MQLTEPIEKLDPRTFPLHRYKPIEKLGHGESGRAFLCFDQFMEQDVVVKTMGGIELDKLIEFQRDATLLCRLNHKGLAQVLDFGCTASGTAYIVSEFHLGVNLNQHISAGEPLPLDLVLKTFVVITEALAQMHVHGILHRDIKTSNILVRNLDASDCAIYLLDLGTGRIKIANMQPNIYEGREIPGDPNYMCPEHASRLHYDSRSEIFALGCTIFEALTGRTPFIGAESLGQLTRRSAPSLTQVSQGISFPHKIEAFVAKCLSRSPETRYQSMPEVSQALKELVKLRLSVEQVEEFLNAKRVGDSSSRIDRNTSPKLKSDSDKSERDSDNFYEDEQPVVRLVNTDWMESSGDSSAELIQSENGTAGENSTPRTNRTRTAKKASFDSASIAAPDESLAYFASANIAFARTEARPKKRTSTAASSTKASSSAAAASPVVAPPEAELGPGLANGLKRIHRSIVKHQLNSQYSAVSVVFGILLLACVAVTLSYMSYLCAPSVEVTGMVVGYQDASGMDDGVLELASSGKLGGSTITKMFIENPAMNLPDEDDNGVPVISTFESDLSNQKIWDDETLSLDQLNLPSSSKAIKSDIAIGQRWDVICRKQWDGKLIVEKLKSGVVPFGQENFEEIHLVISKMVRSIATSRPESAADPSWATDDFIWEIELYPNPSKLPMSSLFPSSQLRLEKYNPTECVMMMKPPAWMTNSKYLKVTLGHAATHWRVESIEECSESAWNHR